MWKHSKVTVAYSGWINGQRFLYLRGSKAVLVGVKFLGWDKVGKLSAFKYY